MGQKKILYLDCMSGISGDMFAGAMIDLGADRDVLARALDSIPAEGFRTEISRVKKQQIDCCDFRVILEKGYENHDDDMEYLFGEGHVPGHSHRPAGENEQGCGHSHTHSHTHADGHRHAHIHRTLHDVREILAGVEMTEGARACADRIFAILADAEAKAHGTTVEKVHFHEVGAVDSIADIVTAAVCYDNLQVDGVYVSPLFEGGGTVRCAHGVLPIPVPAVANILAGSPLHLSLHPEVKGEFITPTGAAIAAALVTEPGLPDAFEVLGVGCGAGKRAYDRANFLRAMLIGVDSAAGDVPAGDTETVQKETADVIYKLETDIDDCSGEVLGYVLEQLLDAGALDAHYLPVYMKKNRPAWQLQVLCPEELIPEMERIIFSETTSIGIRRVKMERTKLPRVLRSLETPYGTAQVKVCSTGEREECYPEYESAAELARQSGRPLREICRIIRESAGIH